MESKVIQIANLVERRGFANPKPKLRYALGRTNHDPAGGYATSKFHVNPYFSCVTAAQMSNRRQWIAEIEPKR